MNDLSRRSFLRTTAGALTAGAVLGCKMFSKAGGDAHFTGLGRTGIQVSRLAMGTGTVGGKYHSNQTKLGMKTFVRLAHHAYDHGIAFFDTADTYGSHIYVREALKEIPRDKVTIMTKMWTRPNNYMLPRTADQFLNSFSRELGTDHFDIVLLHCMVSADWFTEMEAYCEGLSRAKERGIIRAHGVSCHSLAALEAAAKNSWVDVLLARINHAGVNMDDKPENVLPVLKTANERGAGILGMKIYGEGKLALPEQRQASLEFVWGSGLVHAITIGYEEPKQIDDTVKRVQAIFKSS